MIPCEASKFAKAQASAAAKKVIDPRQQGAAEDDEDNEDDDAEAKALKPKKTPRKTTKVDSSASEVHLPEPCPKHCLGFNISGCLHCELCRTCTPE